MTTELVRHSVAEEQFMYPAARKHLEGGDQIADHEIEEHAEAEEVMKHLIPPSNARASQPYRSHYGIRAPGSAEPSNYLCCDPPAEPAVG